MKKLRVFALFILTVLIMFTACSTSKNNLSGKKKGYSPVSKELYDNIANLDSIFFNAFNTKDIHKLEAFLSPDLEFYHDLGGVTDYSQNIEAFRKTFESERKLRRELVTGTLEVYPIKDYGAVETGIHGFMLQKKDNRKY